MSAGGGGFGGGLARGAGRGSGGQEIPVMSSRGVFVSHASEDAPVAQAFCNLIQDVSAGMIPTYSSSSKDQGAGIPYGEDWFKWIETTIRDSGNVVALITPASIGRPWILFEAGFGRAIEGVRVFGLRLGTSGEESYVGPFKAFQNSGSDPDDLLKLCRQLFEGTECRPRDEMILQQIERFLEKVQEHFTEQQAAPPRVNPESEAFFKALEEMKTLVQARPSSAEDFDDFRFMELDHLFHMTFQSGAKGIDATIRATLLLGIATEAGMGWLAPTIQYALEHPLNLDKALVRLMDERMMMRRSRRSPFPPEILFKELIQAVREHQERKFGSKREYVFEASAEEPEQA